MTGTNHKIATTVAAIPRSGIRDFFEIVQSMGDVISLGIGEPDFVTPWHIREAAIYSLEQGKTSYTSNLGTPRLRKEIANYIGKNFGATYSPENEILVTVGVSEGIDLALRALINPGDEVLYHEPCYVSYAPTIALARGCAVAVPTKFEEKFRINIAELEKKVTPRTKVLMLNFPTNPTGAVLSQQELVEIAEFCQRHDLLVISDEIYSELMFDGAKHHSLVALPGMKERTILLHGVSKAFAMTGWRIGFACGPAEIIEAMMKVHQYSIMCAPVMGQEAAVEALQNGAPSVIKMREEYQRRRNFVVAACREYGLECLNPQGTFYIFPSIAKTGLSSKEFALQLLREKKVAVVPGTAFGASGEGFVRCTFATNMEKLKIAFERIGDFLKERQ
ncbi:MAG: aminotransferase class I/II-fold pyridoxal phosphate-dependent enzyme [Chthoniobacterales bacterium]|nr:aminotransferase class I/II-fold pyridoxal phosphate-dependent enzyme [Chthoniobacterales bacterium]